MKPNKCNCGLHPEVITVTDYMSDSILGYYVCCPGCSQIGGLMSTTEEAITIWNEKEN